MTIGFSWILINFIFVIDFKYKIMRRPIMNIFNANIDFNLYKTFYVVIQYLINICFK